MPEIDRIGKVIITMNYKDNEQHHLPHFHVRYGHFKASISLDGKLLAGKLDSKKFKEVLKWLDENKEEVAELWRKAVVGEPIKKLR